jgi:hypothetical protein
MPIQFGDRDHVALKSRIIVAVTSAGFVVMTVDRNELCRVPAPSGENVERLCGNLGPLSLYKPWRLS